jgi:uncharacterized membrane protein
MDTPTSRGPTPQALRDLPANVLPRSTWGVWQVLASWAAGSVIAVVAGLLSDIAPLYDGLLAWDVGGIVYLSWVWLANRNLDAESTAQVAVREDPTRPVSDVVLTVASVASLGAVISTIADAAKQSGAARGLLVALGITSVAASWFVVHTLFTMSYARLYYTDEDGGISFNTDEPPIWTDFAYLAFTIGMTFQVSDTDLQTQGLRRVALRHMLISYLFGAIIIAVTINLVAGLSK